MVCANEDLAVVGFQWKEPLGKLIRTAERELLVSSPYVTEGGTQFLLNNLSATLRSSGRISILTDLSPANVCQGATDPEALRSLSAAARFICVRHLPRLHAKVYVADTTHAIVTSGNLTLGGLQTNYEYGVQITHEPTVRRIVADIVAYSDLGVAIANDRLATYCAITREAREAFRRKQAAAAKAVQRQFELALRDAEDELVRLRLAGGAMHTVFARTILYFLSLHGPLATKQLHPLIEVTHPELCDNTIDRVIDGKRFGKKWKHAVRTAQQQLKKRRLIKLTNHRWGIAGSASGRESSQ